VTVFKWNTHLYVVAVGFNRGLDRDRDGVACEKV
jgi:Excalibur calcium-binding domain